jgi:hypothetical protein
VLESGVPPGDGWGAGSGVEEATGPAVGDAVEPDDATGDGEIEGVGFGNTTLWLAGVLTCALAVAPVCPLATAKTTASMAAVVNFLEILILS